MDKRIYKYRLGVDKSIIGVEMPIGSQIISVQCQHGNVEMWAIVDIDIKETETRKIKTYVTGYETMMCSDQKFIGTVQTDGGRIIVHVFEVLS